MHLPSILHGQITHVSCFMFRMPNTIRVRYNSRTILYHIEPQFQVCITLLNSL
jgi:hypothetical protein